MDLNKLFVFLSIFGGALTTFHLSYILNPILSASLVGLITSYFFPNYALPSYIGAFIGMSSSEILSLELLIFSSFISFLVWVFLFKKIPNLGGKAGFAAFVGVLFSNLPFSQEIILFYPLLLKVEEGILIVITALISTFITFQLRRKIYKFFKSESVAGSSLVGIIAGILYFFFPSLKLFSEVIYASSFAGMTSFDYLKNKKKYYFLIGLFVGIFFLLSISFFPGFGGKLGTIAFLSTSLFLVLIGMRHI